MQIMAALLRFVVIAVFAVGLGLPVAPVRAEAHHTAAMASHATSHASQTLPQDEICREHCLGLSLLPAAVAPAPQLVRSVALPVTRFVETAPSLWPLPEPHPPRL